MKKIIILILVFIAIVCEKREKYMLYMSKNTFKQHADSLIIEEKLNMFLSNVLILSCVIMHYVIEKTHSCRNCLEAFSTEEILKSHINDCFKVNVQQMIQKSKGCKNVKFKNYEGKIKSPCKIYADFGSILVVQDNKKKNSDESYTNKNHKGVTCSYGYELVCVDDEFSKSFKNVIEVSKTHCIMYANIRISSGPYPPV